MTIEELRERCAYWQKRLRLADWEIYVEYVRKDDANGWWGALSSRHIQHRYARVSVVEPGSFIPEDWPREKTDPEYILVHELIHIYTEGMLGEPHDGKADKRECPEDVWAEQAADALAFALVGRDRPDLT